MASSSTAPVGRAFSREWNIIDRSTTIRAQDADWSKVKPIFPDRMAEGERFVKKYGFVPANHGYAIRGDVYRANPWLPFNLYKAFLESKKVWQDNFSSSVPSGLFFGPQYQQMTRKIVGDDPFVYGVKGNRAMLQTSIDFSYEQGFIKEKPSVEDLFAESLRDL
jgi:4,5-dihydroxyphthalate decarboxylase